jgi:hypothetical protein
MPFPAGLALITVSGTVAEFPAGGVASGSISFTSPAWLTGPTDNSVVPPFTKTVQLAADGSFSVQLPATNDPDWSPSGWAYTVKIVAGEQVFRASLQLPYNGGPVDVADVLQTTAPVAGQSYVLLASRGAPNGVASLDGSGQVSAVQLTAVQAQLNPADWATFKATDHGLAGWTFDPIQVQGGTPALATSGLSYVARIRALTSVISNILIHLVTAGSGLTAGQCFATLHNDAGAQLGAGAVTADQAANWASGGLKVMPLQVAQAVTPGAFYRVRYWFNGTTGPSLSRAINSNTAILNAGLSTPNFRFSTADSGLTTAASAPSNIGTQTGGATAHWIGLS